jgi:NAD-dependent DNA ligase adenylation domain
MAEMVDLLELMNRRQRQILVHSFLYYQLNENIISDHTFDLWSKELAELIKNYPDTFKQSVYYEGFKEFDGSSGYDLPYSIPDIQNTGYKLLKLHSRYKKGGNL